MSCEADWGACCGGGSVARFDRGRVLAHVAAAQGLLDVPEPHPDRELRHEPALSCNGARRAPVGSGHLGILAWLVGTSYIATDRFSGAGRTTALEKKSTSRIETQTVRHTPL